MNPATNLQRLTPGKMPKLSARTWNAFADVAESHARDLTGMRLGAQGSTPYGLVQVKNDSAAALPRGSIVGLGDPAITPSGNLDDFFHDPILLGDTPDLALHRRQFAILVDGLGLKEIGPAILTGQAICKVNVTLEAHPFAHVKDADSTQLESDWAGNAAIKWKESGTGTKWAIVEMRTEPIHARLAVLTGTLLQGSFTTADELAFAAGDLVYTGNELIVWDFHMNLGESEPIGIKFVPRWIEDRWVFTDPFCEPSDTLPAEGE